LYRRHDFSTGYITELGISAEGNAKKYFAAAEVGQDHSSDESCGNAARAKDSGYLVNVQITTSKRDDKMNNSH